MSVDSSLRKWRVTITERAWYGVEDIVAETKEAAEELALEIYPGGDRVELLDTEIESVEVEEEDE